MGAVLSSCLGQCALGQDVTHEKETCDEKKVEKNRNDGADLLNRIAAVAEDGAEILAQLGEVVKGGKYQNSAEMAQISTSDYCTLDGIQYVVPYEHDKRISWREAWLGRPILETLMEYNCSRDRAYWENEIKVGRLMLRDGPLKEDRVWEKGLSIWHRICVHEGPIADLPIKVIAVNEHHIVVNKPPSMPVHPCGPYRRNSLMFVLAARFGLRTLKIVHRLDLGTSGVLVYGRTSEAATSFHEENKNHNMQKTYVAEVEGKFPSGKPIECAEPLKSSDSKSSVHPTGKESFSTFTFLHYKKETNTTLVRAVPRSGRKHQLRCHLSHLGYPIVNDPMYNSLKPPRTNPDASHTLADPRVPRGQAILARGAELLCEDCPWMYPNSLQSVPAPLHLHAAVYEGPTFCYTAELPDWGKVLMRDGESTEEIVEDSGCACPHEYAAERIALGA